MLTHRAACRLVATGSVESVRAAIANGKLAPLHYHSWDMPLLHLATYRAKYYDQEQGLLIMRLLLCECGVHVDDFVRIANGVGLAYNVEFRTALSVALEEALPCDEPVIRLLCKAGARPSFIQDRFERWARRRMICIKSCTALLLALQRCTLLPRDVRLRLVRTYLWETRFDSEWDVGVPPLKEPAEDDLPRIGDHMYCVYF
jgi:hypothetical protein